jgi:hypothetical protein
VDRWIGVTLLSKRRLNADCPTFEIRIPSGPSALHKEPRTHCHRSEPPQTQQGNVGHCSTPKRDFSGDSRKAREKLYLGLGTLNSNEPLMQCIHDNNIEGLLLAASPVLRAPVCKLFESIGADFGPGVVKTVSVAPFKVAEIVLVGQQFP